MANFNSAQALTTHSRFVLPRGKRPFRQNLEEGQKCARSNETLERSLPRIRGDGMFQLSLGGLVTPKVMCKRRGSGTPVRPHWRRGEARACAVHAIGERR